MAVVVLVAVPVLVLVAAIRAGMAGVIVPLLVAAQQ
jgi:hypothetical protein